MAISVRRALPEDAVHLADIACEAYARYGSKMPRPPAPVFYDYKEIISAGQTWALRLGDRLCGMVTLIGQSDHLLLRNLAVSPESQGRGVGSFALAFAEREALRLGYHEVRLWTNVHMTENVSFYQSAGFRETHRGGYDGYDFIYMSKLLGRTGLGAAPDSAESIRL